MCILYQREKVPLFLFKANSLQRSYHFVVELSLARMHSIGFFYFKKTIWRDILKTV